MKIRPESKTKVNKPLTKDEVDAITTMEKEYYTTKKISSEVSANITAIMNAHPGLMQDILQFFTMYVNGCDGIRKGSTAQMKLVVDFGLVLDEKYGPELTKGLLSVVDYVVTR